MKSKELLIVPDVNILVSGVIPSPYAPFHIMKAWRNDAIQCVTSEPILADAIRVFSYPKVRQLTHMTEDDAQIYLNKLRSIAHVVPGTTPITISSDPDDNKLFAAAIEAQAEYIVSMDKKHVLTITEFQGIKTIHASDFVRSVLSQRNVA